MTICPHCCSTRLDTGRNCLDCGKPPFRRANPVYVREKIEAYNVAIETLRLHQPADGDPTGIARKLRHALADKLDREIQRWCDALPSPNAELTDRP